LNPVLWPNDSLTLANLGHATLLMNFFGVRMISDPSLFQRVGLDMGAFSIGPHRLVAAPLGPAQLQTVEVILITHAHMDHLDIPSLKALPKTAVVIACSGCAELIRPLGYSDVRELRWGESTSVDGLRVTAMAARHWGRRWPWGRDYGFNSYVLEKDGHRMLLACDSAMTDVFAPLRERPLDVTAFSIGAYDPWIWNHANPEEVWKMFLETGARYLVPIHWGTFRLSKEPLDEPMRRLIEAAGSQADRIAPRQIGVPWTLPHRDARWSSAAAGPEAAQTPADDSARPRRHNPTSRLLEDPDSDPVSYSP
ncbi:MAG TPA: MBL fold metallo-hydrolase, partial [Candidatus Binataceae bacterium]|nr:MBL fold metallo-hydrolase [Candidatus Binataceae bacterium]